MYDPSRAFASSSQLHTHTHTHTRYITASPSNPKSIQPYLLLQSLVPLLNKLSAKLSSQISPHILASFPGMCPLRFILVLFSALLAGYLAWTTLRFSSELETSSATDRSPSKTQDFNFKKMIRNGFWLLVDMASGKYLWRNLRSLNTDIQVNGS
ncbi:uncharacterized protein LOC129304347 [Prosopis cineraria]|uniref:uncharacterized protein LOC129304347 n=1 Tax=Prosopis cineraria TaxID=364024 RepID=UPI00240EC589|nr:uncharacterized protein LOC129304347 [Prosopis cineraria]